MKEPLILAIINGLKYEQQLNKSEPYLKIFFDLLDGRHLESNPIRCYQSVSKTMSNDTVRR